MATDHSHLGLVHVKTLGLGHKGAGAADVEGGDAKELVGVVDASLLEHLGGDGHGGVDGVGDDEDRGSRAGLGAGSHEVLDDAGCRDEGNKNVRE